MHKTCEGVDPRIYFGFSYNFLKVIFEEEWEKFKKNKEGAMSDLEQV